MKAQKPINEHFGEVFNQFIWERLDQSYNHEDPKYRDKADKTSELFKTIRDLLPKEHKHLMTDLDIAEGAVLAYCSEAAYLQGLKDGELLKKEFGGIFCEIFKEAV